LTRGLIWWRSWSRRGGIWLMMILKICDICTQFRPL
jgi:hypothetical protein